MKTITLLLSLLFITGSIYAKPELTPPRTSTLASARLALTSAYEDLNKQSAELTTSKATVDAQKDQLAAANQATIDAQLETITVQRKSDENQKKHIADIQALNKTQDKLYEVNVKYAQLSSRVNTAAIAFGVLFALTAGLLVMRFLGSALVLSGPYGAYVYGAVGIGGFAAGFSLVTAFFRWNM